MKFFYVLCLLLSSMTLFADDSLSEQPPVRYQTIDAVEQGSLLFAVEGGAYVEAVCLHTEVDIRVTGLIARATVRQRFRNSGNEWVEGIYVFPLPETAAVDHMRMQIGERVIEGQIKEKQQAQKIYQKAKSEGKRASLVQQERPNIFTNSVANIGPGEEVTVEIEYQQQVTYKQGDFSLRFPMVVAPKYIPGHEVIEGFSGSGWSQNTTEVADAERITPPVQAPGYGKINPVKLTVLVDAGFKLSRLVSPYHSITQTELPDHKYTIELTKGAVPADRDFELIWTPVPADVPRAALFTERHQNMDYMLMMLIPPKAATQTALSRELVFVIDTSGSMSGSSIRQAQNALQLGLSSLKPGDRFNVIQFNNDTRSLFPTSVDVSPEYMAMAHEYVSNLVANGGTEMALALVRALQIHGEDNRVRQVVFMTDGAVGNEDALFDIIRRQLGQSRLFTVGIGSAPNSHFMRRAARFGRGSHTYIGRIDEVEQKMAALFSQLEAPALTDIRIDWPAGSDPEMWPQRIQDLYAGEPLMLTARLSSLPRNLEVEGSLGKQPWKASMKLDGGQSASGVSILWARSRIAALMDDPRRQSQSDDIRTQIIDTALSHHLVSKYTSLVAVDVTPARDLEDPLQTHALKTNLPAGWKHGQLPQTATPAELQLWIGLLLLLSSLLLMAYQKKSGRQANL